MDDQVYIQRRFTIERDGVVLQDAIVLPLEEYQKLSGDDIFKLKEQRFATHIERLQQPSVEEPPVEEKIATIDKDLASLDEQKTQLLSMKQDLQEEK